MVDYCTKAGTDTQLTDYTAITYLQNNYITTLSITGAFMNKYATITVFVICCTKTEIDSALSDYITSAQIDDSYYTKSEIGTILNLYSPSAQISNTFSKLYIDNTLISSIQTGALYYNKTEPGNMLLSYTAGSHVCDNFYIKTGTYILLADKLINIGDIELPGMLDIGTSGYTNSRIRCDAEVSGYTGYAEMGAANSYGMFLNLSTTRTDGGWMYFKIKNDSYMRLSGGDSKVNIYKDTISSTLDVSKVLNLQRHPTESDTRPLAITNTSSSGSGFIWKFVSTVKGCLFEYLTSASSTSWWQGVVRGSNEVVIKTGSNGLTIKPNGSAVLSGSLTQNSDASLKDNVEDVCFNRLYGDAGKHYC